MAPHNRRNKYIELEVNSENYECQVESCTIVNNTADGERFFTMCPDGEGRDEADQDWAIEIKFRSDYREATAGAGLNRVLIAADQTDVPFVYKHLVDQAGETCQASGTMHVKAPSIGGEARSADVTEVTYPLINFDPATDITYPEESS